MSAARGAGDCPVLARRRTTDGRSCHRSDSTPNGRPIWTAASGQPPHESDKNSIVRTTSPLVYLDGTSPPGTRQRSTSALGGTADGAAGRRCAPPVGVVLRAVVDGLALVDVRDAVLVEVGPLVLVDPLVAAVAQPQQDRGEQRGQQGAGQDADLGVLV